MRRIASVFILITFLFHTVSYAEITADSTYSSLSTTAESDKGQADLVGSYVTSAISSITTIVTELASITCETSTFLNIFKGELTNTCTSMPLMSFALNSLMTPGSFAAFLRLSINNSSLLGYDNCSYFHRADYYDTEIQFGMCLNYKLVPNMLEAIILDGMVGAVKGMIAKHSFSQIQKDYQDAITLSPNEIYNTYTLTIPAGDQKSDSFTLLDFPVAFDIKTAVADFPVMNLAAKKYDDKVCVIIDDSYMQNQIGCKYMKDPYMYSKYAPFQEKIVSAVDSARAVSDANDTPYSALQAAAQEDLGCNNINSCYYSAIDSSMTLLPISSPLINCIQSMLMNVVGASSVCTNTPLLNDPTTSIGSDTSAFYSLQLVMRRSVIALLTLYIIFGGIKIALGKMIGSSEIIMFFLKAILVSYFSIGLVYNGKTFSGMIDWVFPVFFGALNEMASWVAGASTSGLCSYTASDYTGTNYALWDALDCRVATYVGINGVADLFTSLRDSGVVESSSLTPNLGAVNYSIPPYMLLLVPALYTGNMYLFNLAVAWPIMVMAIGAYVVQSTIVCMIFIAIMGILAPLFVPMALFDYTKEYFDKWRNTFFSFVLQPTISVTFMVILFSVYDYGFYGDCEYKPLYIKSPTGATLKSFYIDINGGSTGNCNRTLGWWLSEKYDFSKAPTTNGIPTVTLLELNDAGYAAMVDNAVQGAKSIVLNTGTTISSVAESLTYDSSGHFVNVATASMKEFFQLCMSMMTACFTLYIGYQLTEQLSGFAAELTGGMSVGGMVSSVKQNFSKMSQVASGAFQRNKSAGSQQNRSGGAGGAKDMAHGKGGGFAGGGGYSGGGDHVEGSGAKDTTHLRGGSSHASGSQSKYTAQSSSSKILGSISSSIFKRNSNNTKSNSGNSTNMSNGAKTHSPSTEAQRTGPNSIGGGIKGSGSGGNIKK